jgi:hypothetical protein
LRDDLKFFLTGTRRCKKDKGRHKKDKKIVSALRAIVLIFYNLIRPKGDRITTHDGFKLIKQKKANMTTFYNGGRTKTG